MKTTDLSRNSRATEIDKLEQFSLDVLIGLCSTPKRIPAKYFYDDNGSRLFRSISKQEEYYLSRIETGILTSVGSLLPDLIGGDVIDIIELGTGDGNKSGIVIDGFLDAGCDVNYYPIDISEKAMEYLERNMRAHPALSVHGIIGEYFEGLRYARRQSVNRQLVLFLGSNIGNFDREQGQAFLRRIWKSLNDGDYFVIGFDLKKDVGILTRAYNDDAGFTRDFNLNLLARINRELGGNFDIESFEHCGFYNPVLGAMESYLLSTRSQEVYIADLERSFHFSAYEPLHLEYSFKYLEQDILYLCERTGFHFERNFMDDRRYFADSLWRVKKVQPGQ